MQNKHLRDPSLRTGGLDPGNLKIGSDVALSFDFPNYQNTGHQHNGDHSGTLSKISKIKTLTVQYNISDLLQVIPNKW